jgi:hypothetical protein
MSEDKRMWACIIKLKLNPCREANSKEEFINNLLEEYNNKCWELFDVYESDLIDVHEE